MSAKAAVTLRDGDQVAVVEATGGRVTRYDVGPTPVLAGREHPELFAYRGSLLAPWPNRVTDGRWTWRGQPLQLPLNDPTGVDAALHGLVVDTEFEVVEQSASAVALVHHLAPRPGYPFGLRIEVVYELGGNGLACSLSAHNTGEEDAPVGLGVHPYVAAPDLVDDLVVTLPAHTALVTDEQWREVARVPVEAAGMDFRSGRRLGAQEVDASFTDLTRDAAGQVEVVLGLPGGGAVVLTSGTTCRWLVVYTGHTLLADDRRRSIAVEPMTCGPNALATGDIDVVAPGGSLTLEWGFSLR